MERITKVLHEIESKQTGASAVKLTPQADLTSSTNEMRGAEQAAVSYILNLHF